MPHALTDHDLQVVINGILIGMGGGGNPVPGATLALALGLSERQLHYRIGLLRELGVVRTDTLGNSVDLPLLTTRRGYLFSIDPDANLQWRSTRIKIGLTIFRRTYNEAVKRFAASLPAAQQAVVKRKLGRSFERIIEDIGDVIAMNGTL